jgi:hypothetical protein
MTGLMIRNDTNEVVAETAASFMMISD